ncbi:MAG: hypothetical protein D6725_03520 [Planctomycetota bacterium]|nr:MAG: hypothetical protein D6725_03520 [Planctomycetota bacterium]
MNEPLLSVLCLMTFLLLPLSGLAVLRLRRVLWSFERPATPPGWVEWFGAALTVLAALLASVGVVRAVGEGLGTRPHRWALAAANLVVLVLILQNLGQALHVIAGTKHRSGAARLERMFRDWRTRDRMSRLGWYSVLLPAWTIVLASGVLVLPATFALCGFLIAGLFARFRDAKRLNTLALAVRSLEQSRQPGGAPLAIRVGRQGDTQLATMLEQLQSGADLPAAVAGMDRFLPPWVATELVAAQAAGCVPDVLQRDAGRELARLDETMRLGTWTWLMVYLSVVLTVTVSLVTFMSYFIVPKMKKIWADFGVELADSASGLALSVIDHGPIYMIAAAPVTFFPLATAVWVMGRRLRVWPLANSRPPSRRAAREDTPETLRVLAMLIESETPLPDGLEHVARYESRAFNRERWSLLAEAVSEGWDPWDALVFLGVLTDRQAGILKAAKRAGNLPWALRHLADTIERRRSVRSQRVAECLQPALVVLIAGWVLVFATFVVQPLAGLVSRLSQALR